MSDSDQPPACPLPQPPDFSDVEQLHLLPQPAPGDYIAAMHLADNEAQARWGDDWMRLSWYDRDRDFESPQHSSECHADSAVPGYVDYGINHGARLMVDIQDGRFVFFYAPVEL
jgi:hypothetical protein